MRKILFFDTTLRDGEQSPGFSMKTEEKVQLALQLERLGVDIIEAGFPITSAGDFEAVDKISQVITKSSVAALARANNRDIEAAGNALKRAKHPRIHTFIATSDIHLKHKLRKSHDEVLEMAVEAVKLAKQFCDDVEFSAEDSTRSNPEYLYKVIAAVIEAGAKTVNLPDTVGYITPSEMFDFISGVRKNVKNIDKVNISAHNHNDLGLGVANSLAAIMAGANQIECTINGIGERAGNAALEEIVMTLNVRKDYYKDIDCNINTTEIYKTSKLLSSITGIEVQPNKAIVGKNAFAHESGIHQDGVLKERTTYEVMTAESVGIPANSLVLGKHSGRNAFKTRLSELGYNLENDKLEIAFAAFKDLADKKKEVFDEDLEAIALGSIRDKEEIYSLDYIGLSSGTGILATATIRLQNDKGEFLSDSSIGEGPVDSAFKTIERIAGVEGLLKSYKINAVTQGKDAQGEVVLTVEFDKSGFNNVGKGVSTDVLVASAEAYVDALNGYLARKKV